MKKYTLSALMIVLSLGSAFTSTMNYQATDDVVVKEIKKHTNITQGDVDKIKLVMLGRFQNIAAAGAGSYAAYKGGAQVYGALAALEAAALVDKPETIGMKLLSIMGKYAPTDNKLLWAAAGAAGIGFGAYKLLYTRIQRGILAQVQAYVDYCYTLEIVKYVYSPQNLSQLGAEAGNAAWAGSNSARAKGIDILLAQAERALLLLDQLYDSQKIQELRASVKDIQKRLLNNQNLINHYAQQELNQRNYEISQGIRQAHDVAQVKLAEEQASALRVGKFSLALATLSNFFDKSVKTLVYIDENKGKIASTLLIGSAAVYGAFSWIQYKVMGQ